MSTGYDWLHSLAHRTVYRIQWGTGISRLDAMQLIAKICNLATSPTSFPCFPAPPVSTHFVPTLIIAMQVQLSQGPPQSERRPIFGKGKLRCSCPTLSASLHDPVSVIIKSVRGKRGGGRLSAS